MEIISAKPKYSRYFVHISSLQIPIISSIYSDPWEIERFVLKLEVSWKQPQDNCLGHEGTNPYMALWKAKKTQTILPAPLLCNGVLFHKKAARLPHV